MPLVTGHHGPCYLPIGALKTLHHKQHIDDFQVTTEAKILGVTLHRGIEAPTYQCQS